MRDGFNRLHVWCADRCAKMHEVMMACCEVWEQPSTIAVVAFVFSFSFVAYVISAPICFVSFADKYRLAMMCANMMFVVQCCMFFDEPVMA